MRKILLLFAYISGASFISCSPQPQAITVTCQVVETTTIIDSSEFLGSVKAKAQATIVAENEGTISQILVKPGESVIAGTSLFSLNNNRQIKAPISGIVSNITVNRGEFITKGQALTKVVDNQTLELNIGVPIERSSQLKIGLPVEIIDSAKNVSLKSQINFISPETNKQAILAKASVRNNGSFRDNQLVSAKVIWQEKPGILVPTTAIVRIGGQSLIFVATEQKSETKKAILVAKPRLVVLGDLRGKAYQVASGLEPGEEIIVSDILNLSDDVLIKCRDNLED
jgi:multidrug efflux pump subunit AcrA (membrane-fusion protein)